MDYMKEKSTASAISDALSVVTETLKKERFGFADPTLEAAVLSSVEQVLEELAIQMYARGEQAGAKALTESSAAARRLIELAVETGNSDTRCTCPHGELRHTTHGCWADLPATYSEGVTDCPCVHKNSYPRIESRHYAEDELAKMVAEMGQTDGSSRTG